MSEHDWSLSATNGVLRGDYTFHMTVVDRETGANFTPQPWPQLLAKTRGPRFLPTWNGWMDGPQHRITQFFPDGSSSKNTRYFHAGFAYDVDVAILWGPQVQRLKGKFGNSGMTYTNKHQRLE
ncbi:MAG: hypothetical protein CM15mP71_5250 [Candidatus Poseidoniales archaeon]|nr:MAG: hypothetical protein CM15mP71_5250 [Candidatus Poseidoniales archaeon]